MINTIITIVQLIIIIIVPAFIISLRGTKLIKLVGSIGIAYFIGILLALIAFLLRKFGIGIYFNSDVCEIGSHVAIGIAIPLLLFGTDFKQLKNISKRALLSFGILTFSVLAVSAVSFFIFKNKIERNGAIAGMAIGLYTGGTPNLNAIGSILKVPVQTIATSNISDMIIGGIFYLFLLTLCKPLLKRFLTAPPLDSYYLSDDAVKNVDFLDGKGINKKKLMINFFIAFGMALVGAGIGLAIWSIAGKKGKMTDYLVPSMMISVTIMGIAASFSKKIREVKGNNLLGHYLILVFSIAIAMSLNFETFSSASLYIFLEFAFITIVTFIIHTIICKFFKIDVDCAIVTMTAGIYGPAFIPAVTTQIKNENLTAVGLICGALGYAIGTFLGAGIGYLLLLI